MPRGTEVPAVKKTKAHKPSVPIVAQGTEEWRLKRCGKITASRIADALDFKRDGKEGAGRRDYRIQLVTERLTGIPTDYGFETVDMKRGVEQEPFARIRYAETRNVHVDQIDFVPHPTIEMAGASPDGLVGTDGLIEIKCPRSFTHINYLLDDVVPEDYKYQMIWQMICTGRMWCDFVSYDSRLPKQLQLFVKRFHLKDVPEEELKKIVEGVIKLNAEVEDLRLTLLSRVA